MQVSDIITRARLTLSDPAIGDPQNPADYEPRWDDTSLLVYTNDAVRELVAMRPDLYVNNLCALAQFSVLYTTADYIVMDDYFIGVLAERVICGALREDDSDKNSAVEAEAHYARFQTLAMGG